MNLYAIESYGDIGSGVAIVAAESDAVAIQIAKGLVCQWTSFDTQSLVKRLAADFDATDCPAGLLHLYEVPA